MLQKIFSLNQKFSLIACLVGLLVVNWLVIFAIYQTRPLFVVDVGSASGQAYLENFNASESNAQGSYQWSKDHSVVDLPVVGSPFVVNVQATVYRPSPGLAPVHFSLGWDKPASTKKFEISVAQATAPQLTTYSLEIGGRPALNFASTHLSIDSDSFQPGQGDTRVLGILVNQISIQAQPNRFGFVTPPPITGLTLSLMLLAFQSCLGVLIIRRTWPVRQRQAFFFGGSLISLLALVLFALAAAPLFLVVSLSLSFYLLLAGVAVLGVLLAGEKVFPWLAVALALLTLGNLYGWIDFEALLAVSLTLLVLCLIRNRRFEKVGLNLFFVGVLGLLSSWGLLQQLNFRTSDAERHHYFWLNELDLLIRQGEFYPRWLTDFGFGHGTTIFNFYAPLSRYMGEIFVLAGMPESPAFHAVNTLMSVVGGLGFYLAARQYLGKPDSVIAAAAFIFNPYRMANFYQLGTLAEAVAIAFLPFLLLALSWLLRLDFSFRKAVLLGAASYALVVCSHQLTAFLALFFFVGPFVALNLGWYAWQEKKEGWPLALHNLGWRVFRVGATFTLGLGLSGFYILPAFFESKDIWLSTYHRYNPDDSLIDITNYARLGEWVAHIERLKNPVAGNLAWIGISHIVLAGLGLAVMFFAKGRRPGALWVAGVTSLLMVVSLVMQLNFTAPFWDNVPFMRYTEFPWRLMLFVGLFGPLLIGFLFERVAQFTRYLLLSRTGKARPALAIVSIVVPLLGLIAWTGAGNTGLAYDAPAFDGRYDYQTIYSQSGDVYYLPQAVDRSQEDSLEAFQATNLTPYIERDNKQVADPVTLRRTSPTRFELTGNLSQPGKLVLPIYYFDGWVLTSNGQDVPLGYKSPEGLITAQLPAGSQSLVLKFQDTPIRSTGVIVTILSGLVVLAMVVTGWKNRRKAKVKAGSGKISKQEAPGAEALLS